ncbi:MAG TPA: hypothetical protein VHN11_21000 [Xanthobacteraceae bacterium]|nr:hypothetical protein [Xanthobacteraceae bacterium]
MDDINVGSLPKDRTTANSILRQFGMTLQLIAPTTLNVQSTSKSCEALETASSLLEGSHAKTLVLQEEETVSKDFEAACGEKWHASLAKFNPLSSSWKTRQSLLIGEEFESLETLPDWGMTHGGELWALTRPAHLTSAIESGFWPTPNVCGGGNSPVHLKPKGNHFVRRSGAKAQLSLDQAVKLVQVGAIPTPRASTGKHGIAWVRAENGDHRHNLEDWLATVWLREGNIRIAGMNVNPNWQDWLMGWPIGHTDLMPLEMAKFQQWLDSHGKL